MRRWISGIALGVAFAAAASVGAISFIDYPSPPQSVEIWIRDGGAGSAQKPVYVTPSGSGTQPVSIAAPVDGGFGSAAAPARVDPTGTTTQPVSIASPADGGFGSYGAPARTQEKQLCLDVANKTGVALVLTPDAGQNCVVALPAVQKRIYVTSDSCVQAGGIPASCSLTAVSTGIRVAGGSPELMPINGTAAVMSNGSPPDAGQTATHFLLCGLPTSSAGVLEYTPYASCASTP
jgi:hypothetical protein